MSSHSILVSKDTNVPMDTSNTKDQSGKLIKEIKSMEHHRQVLQSKMEQANTSQYISPSDNIMSPCTAKLNAFRNKQVGKAKPKSLFAQSSSKKLEAEADGPFRPKSTPNECALNPPTST